MYRLVLSHRQTVQDCIQRKYATIYVMLLKIEIAIFVTLG